MTLTALKKYLQENRVVSINDLATQFDTNPDVLRDMLEILIHKGQVQKIQDADVHCGKCAHCHLLSAELYEWIE